METNHDSRFLIPSKKKRILDLLQIIRDNPKFSQHKIARAMQVSSAIVNKYLSSLTTDNYVLIKTISKRKNEYRLSPIGESLYQSLMLEYHAELVRNYSSLKRVIIDNIRDEVVGYDRIGIFGTSETGELVSSIVDTFGKKIVCAFDNDTKKQGSTFYGLRVYPPDKISRFHPEAIIIASIGSQEEIHAQLARDIGKEPIKILRTII